MGNCYQLAQILIGQSPDGEECETEREWRELAEASRQHQREVAVRQIIQKGRSLSLTLARRPWAFLRSPLGHFITADEPVRVALVGKRGQVSIEHDAAITYWPITPKCALLIGRSGLREGNYTVDGFEGRLNLWLAERANFLIAGRPPDEVLQEFEPWFGTGPPQFYEIRQA